LTQHPTTEYLFSNIL